MMFNFKENVLYFLATLVEPWIRMARKQIVRFRRLIIFAFRLAGDIVELSYCINYCLVVNDSVI